MADQRTEEARVSPGRICSACWKAESPSRVYRCGQCHRVFCETCGMEENLNCPFCGHALEQFRGDTAHDEGVHAAGNGMAGNASPPEALSAWPGLSSGMAKLHRQAFTRVSFGAFLGVGICAWLLVLIANVPGHCGRPVLAQDEG